MSQSRDLVARLLASRRRLVDDEALATHKAAEEGGCGVVGFASSVPVGGRHIFEPSIQMHNRGNGKGGGIAAAGLVPEQLGVDAATLRDCYLLQIALLDPKAEAEVERESVSPELRIEHKQRIEAAMDHRDLGLEARPPDVVRYFVRAKDGALQRFSESNRLEDGAARAIEDELVFQNSRRLNARFYAPHGAKRAFVLSHARDLMIFKIIGYAEQVVQYYGLDDVQARIWIAHQRFPTKGRVWHPGGSHPFIGMNEALVHNGDFANYYGIAETLRQHNTTPQFLTDTEVSVLLFDLLHRVYGYPLEYIVESLAPTTELDFERLDDDKKAAYRAIQAAHMHGSPDGPWLFIIARSAPDEHESQLLGITDTSMLRPQVFALQEGDVSIGLIASEKQAIDATLRSLAASDARFRPIADRYWSARGGSHTDGGAFAFTLKGNDDDVALRCTDKFGGEIAAPAGQWSYDASHPAEPPADAAALTAEIERFRGRDDRSSFIEASGSRFSVWSIEQIRWLADELVRISGPPHFDWTLAVLAALADRRFDLGCDRIKPALVLQLFYEAIDRLLDSVPSLAADAGHRAGRIDCNTRDSLRSPCAAETTLVVCARGFAPEGEDCDARLLVHAYELGWRRFVLYGLSGQRFTGCGFGAQSDEVRIDVLGSSGDYLASGIDGLHIEVHGSAQDQVGQIMKRGTLVVHGDVGQTLLYGAKGGEVYVLGNAAGRPLINATGRPRVVINGTCLDFLAESFMAGDPHQDGGFVIVNGLERDDRGRFREQPTPYPGSNLFSLASGGAIYVRDPHRKLVDEQLNAGQLASLDEEDWALILPYLQQNEQHFGSGSERDLLTVDGAPMAPTACYRKITPLR